jgi:hypothetical protein
MERGRISTRSSNWPSAMIHAVAIFAWANRLMLNLGEPVLTAGEDSDNFLRDRAGLRCMAVSGGRCVS